MLGLLYFILCSYGLTFILVYGSIFNKIRPTPESGFLGKLFNCPLCTGFHVGWLLFALSPYTELFSFDFNPLNAFLLACLSAGTTYLLSVFVDDEGIKISRR